MAKSSSVEIVDENPETQEAAFSISPVKLQALVTPEIVEEPLTWQQVSHGLKRNWEWLLCLFIAFVVFIYWRWTAI